MGGQAGAGKQTGRQTDGKEVIAMWHPVYTGGSLSIDRMCFGVKCKRTLNM